MDMHRIILPEGLLRFREILVDHGPKSLLNQTVFLQGCGRLMKVGGQRIDVEARPLASAHAIDVFADWRSRVQVFQDALKSRPQDYSQRQIRIAGGIGIPQFAARLTLFPDRRNAHERVHVALRPDGMRWGLKTGY